MDIEKFTFYTVDSIYHNKTNTVVMKSFTTRDGIRVKVRWALQVIYRAIFSFYR
jgi:hypothetical protein